jgi:hypothetical protein
MGVFCCLDIFMFMEKKIIKHILKEVVNEKLLTMVKNLAKRRDESWEELYDYLKDELDFEDKEAMELVIRTLTSEEWEENPLDVFDFYTLFKALGMDLLTILKEVGHELTYDFSDIIKKDGKVYLVVDDWCEFKDLFRYDDDENVFDRLFCKEDFFEFYNYDPSFDESWDAVNKDSLKIIRDYLIEKFNNKTISVDDYEDFDGFLDQEIGEDVDGYTITLTPEKIDKLIQNNKLGDLIKDSDDLDDLKNEINWSNSDAQNSAVESEVYTKFMDTITDMFGKHNRQTKTVNRWNSKESKTKSVTIDQLVFDITDKFDTIIEDYVGIEQSDPGSDYDLFIRVIKQVLDYNDELLKTGINYDYLYPDSDDVEKFMAERLMDRL